MIDMYHSGTPDKMWNFTLSEFPQSNSVIKLLISTIKQGMGYHVEDNEQVVCYGVPSTLVNLWQQFGHCASKVGSKGVSIAYL